MASSSEIIIKKAQRRIEGIRKALDEIEYLCSGTLLERMKSCGKTSCRCHLDKSARHGPYYEWGHMKDGKLVHRSVTPEQAELLRLAISNFRLVKDLLRDWENETERIIDAQSKRKD